MSKKGRRDTASTPSGGETFPAGTILAFDVSSVVVGAAIRTEGEDVYGLGGVKLKGSLAGRIAHAASVIRSHLSQWIDCEGVIIEMPILAGGCSMKSIRACFGAWGAAVAACSGYRVWVVPPVSWQSVILEGKMPRGLDRKKACHSKIGIDVGKIGEDSADAVCMLLAAMKKPQIMEELT